MGLVITLIAIVGALLVGVPLGVFLAMHWKKSRRSFFIIPAICTIFSFFGIFALTLAAYSGNKFAGFIMTPLFDLLEMFLK